MNNQKMLDVVTMIANVILPDKCDHESAVEIWLRAMKRKAREALEYREREVVGNAAAMREALEAIRNLAFVVQDMNGEGDVKTSLPPKWVIDVVNFALSEPPRQCDVGTAEEQYRRHDKFCDAARNGMSGYHCEDAPRCVFCFLKWAQMPYEAEEGAGK